MTFAFSWLSTKREPNIGKMDAWFCVDLESRIEFDAPICVKVLRFNSFIRSKR